jgi:hypothetical protein
MDDAPEEPQDDEREDGDPKGNMKRHRIAGLHPTMNVRHEPAQRELHHQERHDQPVKYLRGRSIV